MSNTRTKEYGIKTKISTVDLSAIEIMCRVISETKSPETELLIINAGLVLSGKLPEQKTGNETESEAEPAGFYHFQKYRASG